MVEGVDQQNEMMMVEGVYKEGEIGFMDRVSFR